MPFGLARYFSANAQAAPLHTSKYKNEMAFVGAHRDAPANNGRLTSRRYKTFKPDNLNLH